MTVQVAGGGGLEGTGAPCSRIFSVWVTAWRHGAASGYLQTGQGGVVRGPGEISEERRLGRNAFFVGASVLTRSGYRTTVRCWKTRTRELNPCSK